jgi:prolyl-tRNA editing enzyme YbaK/EbsC (Cys-tRNA(Pro) deacylase)
MANASPLACSFLNNVEMTEKEIMKTYIVYADGVKESGYIKAGSHNAAEKRVRDALGPRAMVAYTEVLESTYQANKVDLKKLAKPLGEGKLRLYANRFVPCN